MTEETAKKASELLAKKSKLIESLSNLTNPLIRIDNVTYAQLIDWHSFRGKIDISFCKDDLHAFLLRKLKLEIALLDDQLESLNCI